MRTRLLFFLVFLSLSAAPIASAQPPLDPLPPATSQPQPDATPTAPAQPPATGAQPPTPATGAQPPPVLSAQPPPSSVPATSAQPPPSGAPLATPPQPGTVDAPASSGGREGGRKGMWRLELGYRGSFVPSAGYDPFSTNDVLPQFSATATGTLFAGPRVSFATGLAWDIGSSSATDRGDHATIGVQRLTVPLELRAHFGVWGYVFVRGAPGVVSQHTEVDDPSAPAPLSKTRWLFATDVSAGYAWRVWPGTQQPSQARGLWLQADGGYGWVAQERLDLAPALASGDARVVSGVDLGTISLGGPFFRVAAAASF